MADIIKIRRDTSTNWTSANPILSEGEFGVETDTKRMKMGDGVTEWNVLEYFIEGAVKSSNGYYEAVISGGGIYVNAPEYILTTSGNMHIKMPSPVIVSATLTIGNAVNVPIWYNGKVISSDNTWRQGEIVSVFYDGTKFIAFDFQIILKIGELNGLNTNDKTDLVSAINELKTNLDTLLPLQGIVNPMTEEEYRNLGVYDENMFYATYEE